MSEPYKKKCCAGLPSPGAARVFATRLICHRLHEVVRAGVSNLASTRLSGAPRAGSRWRRARRSVRTWRWSPWRQDRLWVGGGDREVRRITARIPW